jgi:hypothetical protein
MIPMFERMGSVWAESQALAAVRAKAPEMPMNNLNLAGQKLLATTLGTAARTSW